jgi:predicted TIM-barrel fold metal-dependent hydrolase
MLTRRELLTLTAGAGAAAMLRTAVARAKAAQPATAVAFDVPAGACDCHTHIFGDPARYAFASTRVYTPEPASVDEMRQLHRALHMDRVVVVQPSVYGTDNTCTLDALRQLGSRARGVAVVDDRTADAALGDMHKAGVRGIRINLETSGITDPSAARQRLQNAIALAQRRHWHIQINTRLSVIDALRDQLAASPVTIVIDHFGGAQATAGVAQSGFTALVDLVRSGRAYVKISGAYRSSNQGPDYPNVAPLAKALIAANPRRIVWGTDWPHPDSTAVRGRAATDVAPLLQVDDGRLLNQLPVWAPDSEQRKRILVDNPAELYGF